MPEIYKQIVEISDKLENHYKDMQDIEFTIEKGKLYILQTRNGKRTAHAAIRVAVELVDEGLLTKEEALMKVDPESLNQLLHKQLNNDSKNLKEKVELEYPITFLPLDVLSKITGYHQAEKKGIYSNEVHNLANERLVVKLNGGGELASGFYQDIKNTNQRNRWEVY